MGKPERERGFYGGVVRLYQGMKMRPMAPSRLMVKMKGDAGKHAPSLVRRIEPSRSTSTVNNRGSSQQGQARRKSGGTRTKGKKSNTHKLRVDEDVEKRSLNNNDKNNKTDSSCEGNGMTEGKEVSHRCCYICGAEQPSQADGTRPFLSHPCWPRLALCDRCCSSPSTRTCFACERKFKHKGGDQVARGRDEAAKAESRSSVHGLCRDCHLIDPVTEPRDVEASLRMCRLFYRQQHGISMPPLPVNLVPFAEMQTPMKHPSSISITTKAHSHGSPVPVSDAVKTNAAHESNRTFNMNNREVVYGRTAMAYSDNKADSESEGRRRATKQPIIVSVNAVRGLPATVFEAVCVHEMLHAYLHLQRIQIPLCTEEVLCNALSVLYLDWKQQQVSRPSVGRVGRVASPHHSAGRDSLNQYRQLSRTLRTGDVAISEFKKAKLDLIVTSPDGKNILRLMVAAMRKEGMCNVVNRYRCK